MISDFIGKMNVQKTAEHYSKTINITDVHMGVGSLKNYVMKVFPLA